MPVRMAIVDGTGGSDDAQYKKDFTKSFCRTLANQLGTRAYYQRGPNMAGFETAPETLRAFGWLARAFFEDRDTKLMLAGYSRGGSAAIWAAQMLENLSIPVHSMFLFDPVARHVYPGGEVIPGNVAFSRVARRDQSLSFVLKYEGTLNTNSWLGDTSNPTRPAFGNTGLNWRGTGDHQPPKVFKGSHGALGGVGWAFVTEDAACQLAVSSWMGMEMRSRGLSVELGPGSLDPQKPQTPSTTTRFLGQALDTGLLTRNAISRLEGGWDGP